MWRLASSKLSTCNLVSGGNLHQPLWCLACGVTFPPVPDSKSGTGKGTPDVFLQSTILLQRTEAVLRAPSPDGKAQLSGGVYRAATVRTWLMRGRGLREACQFPRGPGSPGPARPGRNARFWPFLPLLYHYYCRFLKNPINTHFKWNLKLLLCERTL